MLMAWNASDLILLVFFNKHKGDIKQQMTGLHVERKFSTACQFIQQFKKLTGTYLQNETGTGSLLDQMVMELLRSGPENGMTFTSPVFNITGVTTSSLADVLDFTVLNYVLDTELERIFWKSEKTVKNFKDENPRTVVNEYFGTSGDVDWRPTIVGLIDGCSFGVFFQMKNTQQAHLALLLFEHHVGVQDQLFQLGYRYFAPFEQDDGPYLRLQRRRLSW